jgi:hypothetical protein
MYMSRSDCLRKYRSLQVYRGVVLVFCGGESRSRYNGHYARCSNYSRAWCNLLRLEPVSGGYIGLTYNRGLVGFSFREQISFNRNYCDQRDLLC